MILIDKNLNLVEIEINEINFRLLNVDYSKIIKFENKRSLNKAISDFLERENLKNEMFDKK